MLDLPLETVAVEEGAAYGAALLAGCRDGTFVDPQAAADAACVSPGSTDPEPAWVAAYADGYERFRRLYPALRAL